MIEVLVSALIILIVAGAVLSLVTATTRSAADQRRKSAAYSAAQEDQARLRALRLSSLNRLSETRTVTLDGETFTVQSTGTFVSNSTGTDSSCGSESSTADYVKITSSISWPGSRTPVVLNSIVSPSTASLDPNHGSLVFTATNGQLEPLSGLGLSGTGAGSFSGSTDATGCANFADLPAGNYTLSTSATGFVDADGNYSPWTQTVGVVASATSPVSLMYDLPGKLEATFQYKEGSSYYNTTADSVVVYNALMPSGAESFGTPGATRSSIVTAEPLFPFKEADTVYAGSCTSNLPTAPEAKAALIVPANGSVKTTTPILLPTLFLTVKKGGSVVNGARVTLTDENCKQGPNNVKRVYTTNSSGKLTEPGMPSGTYKVCVSSGNRWRAQTGVVVDDPSNGTSLTLEIPTSGYYYWGSSTYGSGEC